MKNLINWSKRSAKNLNTRKLFRGGLIWGAATSVMVLCPVLAHASVESSLAAVQEKLVGTLLPLAAICGLCIAGMSFVVGHPGARQHLFYAIVGAIVGFGADSIVALIRSLIH